MDWLSPQWLQADWLASPESWAARWLFVRACAAIYVVAFVSAALQLRPLLGKQGLLPIPQFLERTSFRRQPSLFHVYYSDPFAMVVAWAGAGLSLALVLGLPQAGPAWVYVLVWLIVWAFYQSIVNVGQIWYAFGWESILLEAGFFAIFLGPSSIAPPTLGIYLVLWLAFRVEFGAGLIKLRGDPCWRNLTCLEYHHETQPMPSAFSWHAHHLPRWWHKVEVAGNHLAQLVVPFGLFAPQPVASIAAVVIIVTQGWLVVTGNFAWLNALAIVLVVPALDGDWLTWLPVEAPALAPAPAWFAGFVLVATIAVVIMSWQPVQNMASRRQRMNASFNPLHLVGTYGAFGSITRQRYEVVLEGTADHDAASRSWHEYEFKAKPGDPRRRPPQVAPYHLRIDWLMWFAAMSQPSRHPWLLPLLQKLLAGDHRVLGLLRRNPFPHRPPAHVRAVLYLYRFATPEERKADGAWWIRRRVGEYLPMVSLSEDGHLVRSHVQA